VSSTSTRNNEPGTSQFDEAVRYLLSLGHEILTLKLGLRTSELLLQALGDPHRSYPAVQIAGTNGKGSTAVVLNSICRAAGIKTGLFTSPHLSSVTERVRIHGKEISREAFAKLAVTVRRAAEDLVKTGQLPAPPTFFEQVTAIALLAFRQAAVDVAILETGLGGRLDSTTVARAETIGITPVALDHQDYLGETLEQIAGEKAAIIRSGVTAVIAPQTPVALEVILGHCAEVNVVPRFAATDVTGLSSSSDGRIKATFKTTADTYPNLWLGLRGRHQVINVALAIELAEALRERGFEISRDAIISGVEQARHPGRLELIKGRPDILLDGAHNPAGAQALRTYLDEFVRQPLTLVFGAMRDKNLMQMADILFPRAQRLILTEPDSVRAAGVELLRECAASVAGERITMTEPAAQLAMKLALQETGDEGLVCVTGSLYLVGEVRRDLGSETTVTGS
jgi:dihydrofolate synthase / folylpolyglutamate synthase